MHILSKKSRWHRRGKQHFRVPAFVQVFSFSHFRNGSQFFEVWILVRQVFSFANTVASFWPGAAFSFSSTEPTMLERTDNWFSRVSSSSILFNMSENQAVRGSPQTAVYPASTCTSLRFRHVKPSSLDEIVGLNTRLNKYAVRKVTMEQAFNKENSGS